MNNKRWHSFLTIILIIIGCVVAPVICIPLALLWGIMELGIYLLFKASEE